MLELCILGSSGSYPAPENPCSGYVLRSDGYSAMLEIGAGVYGNLVRYFHVGDIDSLFISHLHPDHFSDIYVFAIFLEFFSQAPEKMPLYGPPGADTALGPFPWHSPAGFEAIFDFTALGESSTLRVGPFEVTCMRTEHIQEAYALRFVADSGEDITYTSDSGYSDRLAEFARGTDLLLAESTWLTTPLAGSRYHMSASEAGILANQAEAGELVLTHLLPSTRPSEALSLAAMEFAGPVTLATPGSMLQVKGNRGAKRSDATLRVVP